MLGVWLVPLRICTCFRRIFFFLMFYILFWTFIFSFWSVGSDSFRQSSEPLHLLPGYTRKVITRLFSDWFFPDCELRSPRFNRWHEHMCMLGVWIVKASCVNWWHIIWQVMTAPALCNGQWIVGQHKHESGSRPTALSSILCSEPRTTINACSELGNTDTRRVTCTWSTRRTCAYE